MYKKLFLIIIASLSCLLVTAQQVARHKIHIQGPTSFYSDKMLKEDIAGRGKTSNPTNKIIDNLDNPSGTIVIAGDALPERIDEVLKDSKNIVFGPDFINFSIENGNVNYRIHVSNNSMHFNFNEPQAIDGIKAATDDCIKKTGEVPASGNIYDSDYRNCVLAFFRSGSHIYNKRYQTARLIIGCVLMEFPKTNQMFVYEH